MADQAFVIEKLCPLAGWRQIVGRRYKSPARAQEAFAKLEAEHEDKCQHGVIPAEYAGAFKTFRRIRSK